MKSEQMHLPMLVLRGMTVMPKMMAQIDLSQETAIAAVRRAMKGEKTVFVVAQRSMEIENPVREELYDMGTVCRVQRMLSLANQQTVRVVLSGEKRGILTEMEDMNFYLFAQVTVLDESDLEIPDNLTAQAMERGIKDLFMEYAVKSGKLPKEAVGRILETKGLKRVVDEITPGIPFYYKDQQELLEETDFWKRYELLGLKLTREIQILDIRKELQDKVKARMDKNQREYILREQLKLIREELGDDTPLTDAEEFTQRTESLNAPEEVKEKLRKEIGRFRNSLNNPAESSVIRTYIETVLDMPWDQKAEEFCSLAAAKQVLQEDHYGLEQVKERILEYLAVRILTQKGSSPILCLAGPPGTGKTSIVRSLARALKRPYVRISLGGIRDEAEIRGHRKTYVGAMPGRIANALQTAGVKNPVILLDEIDKVSSDYRGDTFSALLEVLDSEQNSRFRDHYLEIPLDLSEVLFVTTANTVQTIPRPLLDRMEVIEVSSYTEDEKLLIAMEHLIPKQLSRHGLTEEMLSFTGRAVWKMAGNYTKEAGVRQLEREIGTICRKAAKQILDSGNKKITITERNLHKYLGKEKYVYQTVNASDAIGIVCGLAWTAAGGETIQVEVNVMPGSGELLLTGQLGDVMKESAKTGISYIRSVAGQYGIPEDFFGKHDIHVHIPAGAVPKDGPSAGITMAAAILSAAAKTKVRADLAMTGEVTLRGKVLPVGGLKEKLLAAKNAGIKTVLVPKKNKADVEELSLNITKGIEIVPVESMEEVLKLALKGEEYGYKKCEPGDSVRDYQQTS